MATTTKAKKAAAGKSSRYNELKKMLEERRRELMNEVQGKMRDVRAPYLVLAGQAVDVGTGAADPAAFDPSGGPSQNSAGLYRSDSELQMPRPMLAGAARPAGAGA